MHRIKRRIDLLQLRLPRHELPHLQGPRHVLVHDPRELGPPLGAAECGAPPHAARHELEGPRGDFLAAAGDADNARLAPPLVARLQRRPHRLGLADGLEGVVQAAVSKLHKHLLDRLIVVLRVHALRGAELLRQSKLLLINIHRNNPRRARDLRALNAPQTHAAQPEHRHRRAALHLARVAHRAHAGGDAAAKQADLPHRGVLADFDCGDFGQYGVLGERAGSHVVINRLPLARKPRRPVGHHPLPLGLPNRLAQIRLPTPTKLALLTLRHVQRHHMIP
eukprot:CAMPEP_0174904562 /NCGR_PEP_ID=MMETSP0167-20121228/49286_1 /TAXON_ID=38298 /ORGANISM="Rhodella maculata, Strain CCMP736" /LENGTH=278 /DNA_ID=CAMNT_0016147251 /DNA_START=166 /DNA_END=999 /DNA_ORIENTATION=+